MIRSPSTPNPLPLYSPTPAPIHHRDPPHRVPSSPSAAEP